MFLNAVSSFLLTLAIAGSRANTDIISRPEDVCRSELTNTFYFVGDTWDITDYCSTCGCAAGGEEFCRPMSCPEPPSCEQELITREGECCPICPVCDDYPVGTFQSANDSCKGVKCNKYGELTTYEEYCIKPFGLCSNGADWMEKDGVCSSCKECPSCEADDGTWYFPGPVPHDDPCVKCSCDHATGDITCYRALQCRWA